MMRKDELFNKLLIVILGHSEPNNYKWVDSHSGYLCYIVRHGIFGSLCGYVRIPKNHSLYRKDRYKIRELALNVHGGITYSGIGIRRYGGGNVRGFFIGFDCAHYKDLVLSHIQGNICTDVVYRDLAYVKSETTKLAKQLKRIE